MSFFNFKPSSLLTCLLLEENTSYFRKYYWYWNGKLQKGKAKMYGEHLAQVKSFNLEELHKQLTSQENVLIMGYPQGMTFGDKFYVISNDDFDAKFPKQKPPLINQDEMGNVYAVRKKNTFNSSHIIPFDYDASVFTPDNLRFTNPADLMAYLAEHIHSDFAELSYVASYSSSAGICTFNNDVLKDTARFHIYFFIKDVNDIARFKKALEAKLTLTNSFWTELDEKGNERVKYLLDLSVFSSGHLMIEQAPKLGRYLKISKPEPVYHQGTIEAFDTLKIESNFTAEQLKKIAKVNLGSVDNKVPLSLYSVTGIKRDYKTFKYSTLIKLDDNSIASCAELEERLLKNNENISCFSPFREENNHSCFVSLNKRKQLYLHDMTSRTTYFVCEKPIKNYSLSEYLPVEVFPETKMVNNRTAPIGVMSNTKTMLECYGITVRYNKMTRTIDTDIPNLNASIDNKSERSISEISDLCDRNQIPIADNKLCGHLLSIADENRYHPVQEWILSKEWDGDDRFSEFYDTVEVKPEYEAFKRIVIPKMLQAIVTGAFQEEGSRFESVLVFAGKQGIGKTRWFSRLLPKGMVYDGCELDIKNKDSVLTALSSAVVELGEIDTTFKKSGMSTLKAFLSKETDKIRKPYARTDSHLPRRNVFVGTVNDIAFLSDETGNRRFWVLHTTKLDYQHNVDMQQLFAQVYELQYLHDEPLYLNDEEIALQESLVDNHRIVDPLEEKLLEVFDFTKPRINYMTSTQILNELNFEATKSESTRMGRILSNRFDLQTKKMNGGYVHYLMPEKISCFTHTDLGQNQVDMGI